MEIAAEVSPISEWGFMTREASGIKAPPKLESMWMGADWTDLPVFFRLGLSANFFRDELSNFQCLDNKHAKHVTEAPVVVIRKLLNDVAQWPLQTDGHADFFLHERQFRINLSGIYRYIHYIRYERTDTYEVLFDSNAKYQADCLSAFSEMISTGFKGQR